MNERLKEIRTSKGMNQHDFAKSLGIGQSTLAMMEVGKRDITERHIKTICAIYGVDEHWFRTGDGKAFYQNEKSLLDRLTEEYGLSKRERDTISSFLKLSDKDRAAVMGYVDALVDKISSSPAEQTKSDESIESKVEKYRQQLLLEEERASQASSAKESGAV